MIIKSEFLLKNSSIFAYGVRKMSCHEKQELKKITNDLVDIIKISHSPYSARVFLVPKRNGFFRTCVDLRPLNERFIFRNIHFPV